MNTWLFYLTDNMHTMTAVTGTGTNQTEAETDARAKWAALVSGRPDNAERNPIISVIYSEISTELRPSDMPGLIL